MIDTGAKLNLISVGLTKLLGLEQKLEKVDRGSMNANRSPMKLEGKIKGINAKLINEIQLLVFYVAPKFSCDLILRHQFDKTFEMHYSSKKNEDGIVEMCDEKETWIQVPSINRDGEIGAIRRLFCIWLEEDECSQTTEVLKNDEENIMLTSFMIKPKGNIMAKIRMIKVVVVRMVQKQVADKV
ncbi:hypothetical protein HMI54_009947 [Coelomomyces lativittatus]|nr:hypothetical protein HMI54_009947 [Coelomomyces lativittatus]